MTTPARNVQRHSVEPRVAALSVLLLWLFYFVTVSVRAWITQSPGYLTTLDNRVWVALAGVGFTWLLYLGLRRLDGQRFGIRIAAALIGAAPVSTAYATVNYLSFYVLDPDPAITARDRAKKHPGVIIADNAIHWYSFIAAWAALYLALSYAAIVREQERETARLRGAAQTAELRALRYQVNPHFLFNTLNSISALVMAGRNADAETMILNLSSFFRTTLSTEAADDVTLEEEVALQRLYLTLEGVRFPERLAAEIVVPTDLASACVPAMILQPLIENAIKYGVAPAQRRVALRVVASCDADGLRLDVEDDGGGATIASSGTGTGLRNVADRLMARYGVKARLISGPLEHGGFRASLHIPLVHRDC